MKRAAAVAVLLALVMAAPVPAQQMGGGGAQGYQQLWGRIHSDHQGLQQTLTQLATTTQPAEKERLFVQLKRQAVPHMEAEERVLYPALAQNPRLRHAALRSVEEHRLQKNLMSEMERTPVSDERWNAQLELLSELSNNHILKEEQQVLPQAAAVMGDEQMMRLAQAFQSAKQARL